MNLEGQIAAAIRLELVRQAEEGELIVSALADRLQVSGPIDLEALAMAVAGSVAGGP